MLNLLKNLIRWANITKSGDDSANYPIQQISYLGKTADTVIVFPYGLHANIPANHIGLMFAVQGSEENRAMLPLTGVGRPQLAAGEIALFNKDSGAKVILKANGAVEITAPGGVTITGDLTVSGNTELGATVTSNGINIGSTHVHGGVTTGSGTTAPPS